MKWLKYIFGILAILILLVFLYVRFSLHESRPQILDSEHADSMANEMLTALNADGWDSLPIVRWSFPRGHDYLWDRVNNNAIISWGDYEVHLNMDEVDGSVYKEGEALSGSQKTRAIKKAWKYWCNDSFWFIAPFKVFDPGTRRSLAIDKDGKQGLLVTYETGGVTPGDQYLWYMDSSGLPTGFKMWVKIVPVGGVYATLDDWQVLPGGGKVASTRNLSLGGLTIELTNIQGAMSWDELGYDQNPVRP